MDGKDIVNHERGTYRQFSESKIESLFEKYSL